MFLIYIVATIDTLSWRCWNLQHGETRKTHMPTFLQDHVFSCHEPLETTHMFQWRGKHVCWMGTRAAIRVSIWSGWLGDKARFIIYYDSVYSINSSLRHRSWVQCYFSPRYYFRTTLVLLYISQQVPNLRLKLKKKSEKEQEQEQERLNLKLLPLNYPTSLSYRIMIMNV